MAGRPKGYNRDFCENSLPFDLRELARWEGFVPGAEFTLRFANRGSRAMGGCVGADTDAMGRPRSVTLGYTMTVRGASKDVTVRIALDWTPCTYGGRGRPWFLCPACSRRCAILYCGVSRHLGHFVCRKCGQLHYESQYMDPCGRRITQAVKKRRQMGQESGGIMDTSLSTLLPLPNRPKGMHWRTYLKRLDESVKADVAGVQAMLAM